MTLSATGIGKWPESPPEPVICRACRKPLTERRSRGQLYHDGACQAERRRREHEKARERERGR